MSSIRSRLAGRFAWLVVLAVAVFAVAVYLARRAGAYRDLEDDAVLRGNLALRIVQQAGTSNFIFGPAGPEFGAVVRGALDAVPGYVVIFDRAGQRLYSSPNVRQLTTALDGDLVTVTARRDLAAFDESLRRALEASGAVEFILSRDRGLMLAREDLDRRRVVVGISRSEADVSWREVPGSALLVFPLILLLAVGGAYLLAGDVLAPVDRIRQEVEAITDGRSLHRRVALETADDEMARLTGTLNAMIGRLEQSFGGLRRFTADASHELKTPLTVLRADIERAMHAAPRSNEHMVALEEALQQTTRMSDLVDSLLTLARADEGRFDLHREPVPLEPLAREVFETAQILGERSRLKVRLARADAVVVLGDRTRLRQLFLNLVTNAIKYTSAKGSVELSLKASGGFAEFAVRDSGMGIAAADLPYIFDRFWRADRARSRTTERGGFGLGLAISQWIAQAHGGQLTVESRLHRGSTFTARFPLLDLDGARAPEGPGDAQAPPAGAPPTANRALIDS